MQIFTADDGTLYTKTPAGVILTPRTVPTGCVAKGNKPSFFKYRRMTGIVGRYDRMVVYFDQFDEFDKGGIAGPVAAPVLASGGGTGTIDGDIIGHYTYVHKNGTTVLLESPPSPPSTTITVSRVGTINWSSIAATSPDARVTHIRLYRADAGNDSRMVTEFALGTTTYSDTTAYLSLGGVLQEDGGLPPYTLYAIIYKDRAYYAGDPTYPDRVWFSVKEQPELVDAENFFRTASGEAVTGLGVQGDTLVVFTPNTMDVVKEFATDDFARRQVSPSIGCISHHSIVNINDRLWFASSGGIYVWDGSLRNMTYENRTLWRNDYADNPTVYERCFAVDDTDEHCYLLSLPFSDHTFRWVGYYLPCEPALGGNEGQPWWFFDYRTRLDKALGRLTYAANQQRYKTYCGSDDGYLREENVVSDGGDDSDSYAKALLIETKAYLMNEPGGDSEEGKTLVRFWSYVQAESAAWTVKVYGGDESAGDQVAEQWKDDVAASALTSGGHDYVAKTVHPHVPEQVSGRAFIWRYVATSPKHLKWRGLGGYWTLGPAFRGRAT